MRPAIRAVEMADADAVDHFKVSHIEVKGHAAFAWRLKALPQYGCAACVAGAEIQLHIPMRIRDAGAVVQPCHADIAGIGIDHNVPRRRQMEQLQRLA